jgi:hypothetical protein
MALRKFERIAWEGTRAGEPAHILRAYRIGGYRNAAIVIAAILATILILSSCWGRSHPKHSAPSRTFLDPPVGPKHVKARVESENASRGTLSVDPHRIRAAHPHIPLERADVALTYERMLFRQMIITIINIVINLGWGWFLAGHGGSI